MDADTILFVSCDCQDPAHIMQIHLAAWDNTEPNLYVSVQLNPVHPWWKRCWIGLGYVLGKRSRFTYGHWDAGGISPKSARQLMGLLRQYLSLLNTAWDTSTGTGAVNDYTNPTNQARTGP